MCKTSVIALSLLLLSPAAYPETTVTKQTEARGGHGRWWKISVVVLAAATSVDAYSSWGSLEANPVLRNGNGRFGSQGVALKALIFGGTVGAQYLLLKSHPKSEKYGTLTNFALAGVLGAAAASNFQRGAPQALNPPSPPQRY
ncbi:MAG: hypothetical protein HY235_20870 [Acidobacteria bacterium]|nr:hypothetical protein [Acidobacteriota bacterium]